MSRDGTPRRQHRATGVAETLRVLPAYLAFGVLKHVMPLPRLARLAWRDGAARSGEAADADAAAERATRAAFRISRRLGAIDRDCLQRSLLLYRELSRAGCGPVLRVGFRREGGAVRGHAWIETGAAARPLLGEDVSSYTVALSFGASGVLIRPVPTTSPATDEAPGRASAPAART